MGSTRSFFVNLWKICCERDRSNAWSQSAKNRLKMNTSRKKVNFLTFLSKRTSNNKLFFPWKTFSSKTLFCSRNIPICASFVHTHQVRQQHQEQCSLIPKLTFLVALLRTWQRRPDKKMITARSFSTARRFLLGQLLSLQKDNTCHLRTAAHTSVSARRYLQIYSRFHFHRIWHRSGDIIVEMVFEATDDVA